MKVLVTGAAGLIGSHAAEYYALRDVWVIAFDKLLRSKLFNADKKTVEYNWEYLAKYKNIKRIKGDVRSPKDILKAIGNGVDAVIHTAAQPGIPSSIRIPQEDFDINASGTLNVLEALRQRSPQAAFIYCSTNKVYGENVDKIPLIEKETGYIYNGVNGVSEEMSIDLTGHTPYGVSKLIGDLYTQEYGHIYGMKTAVFRMSCTYGQRQFGFADQGWASWFVIASILHKPITIYGSGKQVRDLLYVEDLIPIFDTFVKSDLRHSVFNIGGGPANAISLLDFLDFLQKEMQMKPKISFSEWRPKDQKVYISDITKVQESLNWRPKVSIPEGVERLIKWVKQNRSLF